MQNDIRKGYLGTASQQQEMTDDNKLSCFIATWEKIEHQH